MKHIQPAFSFAILAALVALCLGGCASSTRVPWQIVSQHNPNPLFGERRFAVSAIEFESLIVGEKSETDYLSEKDSDARASWERDKAGLSERFAQALQAHGRAVGDLVIDTRAGEAKYIVQPIVQFIEPGVYAGIYQKPSRVNMTARVFTSDGELIDEIRMTSSGGSGLHNPSIGQRLRERADTLGRWMADYLSQRVASPIRAEK